MDIEKIETYIDMLAALGQETRLAICHLLTRPEHENGLQAGQISAALDLPQNTLSFHLSHLKRAGLVEQQRDGRYIIYKMTPKAAEKLILFLATHLRRG